jgi:menaquinone-dependent protoporphyrinogen IX oxidase
MKSLVVYYSRYGNTARVADAVLERLRKKGEAEIVNIEYKERSQSLIARTFYRFFPMFVRLAPVTFDLKGYDLLCMGIPVWGGKPSAPVTKYLLLTKNAIGKKAVCFYTYGFMASAKKCSRYIEKMLKRKGFSSVISVFVHWDDVGNEVFLNEAIVKAIP